MIFVTVGTTMPFDELIEAMDNFKKAGTVEDHILCQIGNGTYIPTMCEYFRFKPGLKQYLDQASVVVGHGGTGTVLSMLKEKKAFVAVVNPRAADRHQSQFLSRLGLETDLLWTENLAQIPELISKALNTTRTEALSMPRLADDLRMVLIRLRSI